jgi:hypothetical protein
MLTIQFYPKGESEVRICTCLVGAMFVIAMVGCGGGSDTTETLTKAQFIKQGDTICRSGQARKEKALHAWRREEAEKGDHFEQWSAKELGEVYLTVLLPPIKRVSKELTKLAEATPGAKGEEFAEALASAVGAIEEEPVQILRGTPYGKTDELAQEYGFKACIF